MKHIDIIGISVTPADCYIDSGLETNIKILSLFNKNIEVAKWIIEGKNPFPEHYRVLSLKSMLLPDILSQ